MKSNLTEAQKVLLSIEYFNDKYNLNLVKTASDFTMWDCQSDKLWLLNTILKHLTIV